MTRKKKFKKDTSKNKTLGNKAVLAPFGKYAAIAVMLVGVIVTTAIMVDKRLNSVESQIAELESQAAKLNGSRSGSDTTIEKPVALNPGMTP